MPCLTTKTEGKKSNIYQIIFSKDIPSRFNDVLLDSWCYVGMAFEWKQEVFIFPPLFRQTAALPCSSAILHIVSAFIHHRHNTMLISIQFVIMYKLKAKTPIHEFNAINTHNNVLLEITTNQFLREMATLKRERNLFERIKLSR